MLSVQRQIIIGGGGGGDAAFKIFQVNHMLGDVAPPSVRMSVIKDER